MLSVVTYLLNYLHAMLQALYGLSLLQDSRNRSRLRGFICQSVIVVLMVDVSTQSCHLNFCPCGGSKMTLYRSKEFVVSYWFLHCPYLSTEPRSRSFLTPSSGTLSLRFHKVRFTYIPCLEGVCQYCYYKDMI